MTIYTYIIYTDIYIHMHTWLCHLNPFLQSLGTSTVHGLLGKNRWWRGVKPTKMEVELTEMCERGEFRKSPKKLQNLGFAKGIAQPLKEMTGLASQVCSEFGPELSQHRKLQRPGQKINSPPWLMPANPIRSSYRTAFSSWISPHSTVSTMFLGSLSYITGTQRSASYISAQVQAWKIIPLSNWWRFLDGEVLNSGLSIWFSHNLPYINGWTDHVSCFPLGKRPFSRFESAGWPGTTDDLWGPLWVFHGFPPCFPWNFWGIWWISTMVFTAFYHGKIHGKSSADLPGVAALPVEFPHGGGAKGVRPEVLGPAGRCWDGEGVSKWGWKMGRRTVDLWWFMMIYGVQPLRMVHRSTVQPWLMLVQLLVIRGIIQVAMAKSGSF